MLSARESEREIEKEKATTQLKKHLSLEYFSDIITEFNI